MASHRGPANRIMRFMLWASLHLSVQALSGIDNANQVGAESLEEQADQRSDLAVNVLSGGSVHPETRSLMRKEKSARLEEKAAMASLSSERMAAEDRDEAALTKVAKQSEDLAAKRDDKWKVAADQILSASFSHYKKDDEALDELIAKTRAANPGSVPIKEQLLEASAPQEPANKDDSEDEEDMKQQLKDLDGDALPSALRGDDMDDEGKLDKDDADAKTQANQDAPAKAPESMRIHSSDPTLARLLEGSSENEHRRRANAHSVDNSNMFNCIIDPEGKWRYEWSIIRKNWCCANKQKGCPGDTTSTAAAAVNVVETTTKPITFDCHADFETWEHSWSTIKKDWCCQYSDPPLGCAPYSSHTPHGLFPSNIHAKDIPIEHQITGKEMCEDPNWETEELCLLAGCCMFDADDGCKSAVGSDPCAHPNPEGQTWPYYHHPLHHQHNIGTWGARAADWSGQAGTVSGGCDKYEEDGRFSLCAGSSDCRSTNNFCAEGTCDTSDGVCKGATATAHQHGTIHLHHHYYGPHQSSFGGYVPTNPYYGAPPEMQGTHIIKPPAPSEGEGNVTQETQFQGPDVHPDANLTWSADKSAYVAAKHEHTFTLNPEHMCFGGCGACNHIIENGACRAKVEADTCEEVEGECKLKGDHASTCWSEDLCGEERKCTDFQGEYSGGGKTWADHTTILQTGCTVEAINQHFADPNMPNPSYGNVTGNVMFLFGVWGWKARDGVDIQWSDNHIWTFQGNATTTNDLLNPNQTNFDDQLVAAAAEEIVSETQDVKAAERQEAFERKEEATKEEERSMSAAVLVLIVSASTCLGFAAIGSVAWLVVFTIVSRGKTVEHDGEEQPADQPLVQDEGHYEEQGGSWFGWGAQEDNIAHYPHAGQEGGDHDPNAAQQEQHEGTFG